METLTKTLAVQCCGFEELPTVVKNRIIKSSMTYKRIAARTLKAGEKEIAARGALYTPEGRDITEYIGVSNPVGHDDYQTVVKEIVIRSQPQRLRTEQTVFNDVAAGLSIFMAGDGAWSEPCVFAMALGKKQARVVKHSVAAVYQVMTGQENVVVHAGPDVNESIGIAMKYLMLGHD